MNKYFSTLLHYARINVSGVLWLMCTALDEFKFVVDTILESDHYIAFEVYFESLGA